MGRDKTINDLRSYQINERAIDELLLTDIPLRH